MCKVNPITFFTFADEVLKNQAPSYFIGTIWNEMKNQKNNHMEECKQGKTSLRIQKGI